MPTRITTLLLGVALLLLGAPAAEPTDLEDRMSELASEVEERMTAHDWEAAESVILEMAALDVDHPKAYLQAVLLQRARGHLEDAPALMGRVGPPTSPGRAYGDAVLRFFVRRPDEAPTLFRRALEAYRRIGHIAGQAACHAGLGNVDYGSGRLDEAQAHYEQAVELQEQIGDLKAMIDLMDSLARVESKRGNHERAVARQRRVVALREQLGDVSGQARTWSAIGQSLRRAGDPRSALEALEQSLTLYRRINHQPGQITSLKKIQAVHSDLGEWDRAVARLHEALEISASHDDPAAEPALLRLLGNAYLSYGRPRQALAPFESSSAKYRELGDAAREAQALNGLGTALHRLGELRRAAEVLASSLQGARAAGDRALEAAAQANLGNVRLAAGEVASALVHQRRALELYREDGDHDGELASLNNLGSIYFTIADFDRARQYIEETLALAEERRDAEAQALARHNLGAILAELDRPEAALAEMESAIRIRQELKDDHGQALTRANAAEALLRLGDRERAGRYLTQALAGLRAAGDRRGEAWTLNLVGLSGRIAGDSARALDVHRRALTLAREVGLPDEQWRAHEGLAAALEDLGRPEEALGQWLSAIDRVEKVRARLVTDAFRTRFLATKIGLYERALELLTSSAGAAPTAAVIERSFELAERARARGLLDLLAESRASLQARVAPPLVEREARILDRIGAATVRLSAAPNEDERAAARAERGVAQEALEQLKIEIHRNAPHYGAIVYPRPASLRELQQTILHEGETLLSYFVGARRAWVWIVDRHRATLHELGQPEAITRAVDGFLEQARGSGSPLGGGEARPPVAERLADLILPRRDLVGARRLLIAPDGPLHHLPFEALPRNGRYLIEDHEVAVIPSSAALRLMRERARPLADDGFLGIGDPATRAGDGALPPLRFSRMEVERIAELFADERRTTLLGAAATKPALRALDLDRYRFIHFATHGWLDDAEPELSGLRLSPVAPDDPDDLLSRDEILALRLASEVVILSACRSGLGELLEGEGLVGMTRAFLFAGARSVGVSLWNVGDRSTADFMQELYRGVRSGATVPASLRRAKLSFLESDRPGRAEIFHWAPFVLVGDPGPLDRGPNSGDPGSTK